MKINLEVLHSCSIKRKKPWPKLSWIGNEKENLFLLDTQRISIIDPSNGKTRKKVSKLTNHMKSLVSHNTSDNGLYFIGVLNSGDLILWNKDKDQFFNIAGLNEFALKLGSHAPSVFVSDDAKKIILITSRNKIFVWESDSKSTQPPTSELNGNWSDIVASKDVKTVEDNKELVLHVRFNYSPLYGYSATCCFAFNYESKLVVNVLKIRWLNLSEISSPSQCRFDTFWVCHQPSFAGLQSSNIGHNADNLISNKLDCLYTRGAYVIKLSHTSDIIALACNQKYVEHNCLVFISALNGNILQVNLRNFGLNVGARGRHYWIQELSWMYNDLYLAGITKHGAIFLVSRLGQPLLIHAIGKEINMGPALYLTLHPLIIVRGKSTSISMNKSGDTSLGSTNENEDNMRQRYSIARHPQLPLFVCSDGYLVCTFRLESSFSTQSRLIRELMHETIGLLNAVSQVVDKKNMHRLENPFHSEDESVELENQPRRSKSTKGKRKVSFNSTINENVPDWGLSTNQNLANHQTESDSGVDSNDGQKSKPRANTFGSQKIAEGKIIFSFLPQILPISDETFDTNSIVKKMEHAFEYLQTSWSLLVSTSTLEAVKHTYECDQTAKAIQQAFTHFSYLFLILDSKELKEFQIYRNEFNTSHFGQNLSVEQKAKVELVREEEFKCKVLANLFMRMIQLLYFDPSAKHNPNSHMIIYVPRFAEKFIQSIVKFDNVLTNVSRMSIFGLVYCMLSAIETSMRSMYKFNQNERFMLNTEPMMGQHSQEAVKPSDVENEETEQSDKATYRREKCLLVRSNKLLKVDFVNGLFEKCWQNLMHYAVKHRATMQQFGTIREKQVNELNLFIMMLQRRMDKFPASFNTHSIKCASIQRRKQVYKLNKADLIYLVHSNLDAAIDQWTWQLRSLFESIRNSHTSSRKAKSSHASLLTKSVQIAHKIFYACLANYKLRKLVLILSSLLMIDWEKMRDKCESYSQFSLLNWNFKCLEPPKRLQRTQMATISLVKSFARFVSLYLTNKETLYIYSIHNPVQMPSLFEIGAVSMSDGAGDNADCLKIELSREKLTKCVNEQSTSDLNLSNLFTADKVLEMFVVCGLYDEAIYFLNLINDWKSAFLLSSILKESVKYDCNEFLQHLPAHLNCEISLTRKLCSVLGLDKLEVVEKDYYMKLMEKHQMESVSTILNELLLCSVMTKANVLEPLLHNLMESLVVNVHKLNAFVPNEFYLPAPPIFCLQMQTESEEQRDSMDLESKMRMKICVLIKCIMVLLISSNLHVPLIKWYLDELVNSSKQMRDQYGIGNTFKLNLSLSNLLSTIRYQKLGYISENILNMFRDFCAIVFYLDLRDHFSLSLRQYTRHLLNNQLDAHQFRTNSSHAHSIEDICLNMIDYGNMMLSYKSLLKRQHVDVQDIVLSTISRLTNVSSNQHFNLEEKLAMLAERKYTSAHSENQPSFVEDEFQTAVNEFDVKFNKLIETWRQIGSKSATLDTFVSMADVYAHNLQAAQQSAHQKLRNLYGQGEDLLDQVYVQKMVRNEPSTCGEYEFERSFQGAEFLELFFKLSFDQTENWDGLTQSINQTPLLPAFYDAIRAAQLPTDDDHVDRQYIITRNNNPEESGRKKSLSEMEQFLKAQEELKTLIDKDLANQIEEVDYGPTHGLFRTYSEKSLDKQTRLEHDKLRKSVSFSNLNAENDAESVRSLQIHNQEQESRNNQPLRVLDFGQKYVQVSHLAIWLMKWSMRFQKLLINNNIMASRFWQSGEESTDKRTSPLLTFRMDSVNANMLVASVYLADGNNLSESSLRHASSLAKMSNGAIVRHSTMKNDDEFTQVSATLKANNKPSNNKESAKFDSDISESTTLDISSLTEHHMNNYFSKQPQQPDEETQWHKANESHRRQSSSEIGLRSSSSSPAKSPSKSPNKLKLLVNQSSSSFSLMKTKESEVSRLSMASTHEASEFYNLHNIKPVENGSVLDEADVNTVLRESVTTIAKENENGHVLNKSSRSIKSSAFGFITNMFGRKSNSKSPSRSKSPVKNPSSANKNDAASLQSIQVKSTVDQAQTDRTNLSDYILPLSEQQQQQQQQQTSSIRPPSFPLATLNANQMAMTSHQAPTDIQSLIRDELKRIVQIQHDTVMSFLNNGAQLAPHPTTGAYGNQSSGQTMRGHHALNNIEQQLTSILKQNQFDSNGPPMEFVIETKIKTASNVHTSNSTHSIQNNKNEMLKSSSSNFVRTFEYDQAQKSARKPSEFIKIKLLKIDSNEQQVQPYEQSARNQQYASLAQTERFNLVPAYCSPPHSQQADMPLLSFRNERHQIVHQNIVLGSQTPRANPVTESPTGGGALNKHVKEYIEITSQKTSMSYKNFPLLKLNQERKSDVQQHQVQREEATLCKESTIKPDQPSERTARPEEVPKEQQRALEPKESKEIQMDKPLYDGYILAPGVFDDMLNKENEKVSASSALAHYNATEHLRNRHEQATSRTNKKESCTMTDVSTNANPIAPDILFKLKFDLNRKNRQVGDVNENKDFLNVVDLDSNAVEDILKLIEHEQNKRQGKYVSISKKKHQEKREDDLAKSDLLPEKEVPSKKEETDEGHDELDKSQQRRGDALTEKLFTEKLDKTQEDEFDKFDKFLNDHSPETSRLLDITDSKQRMLTELKAIDQKIKLMNEMANEMGSDYSKYSQVLHKVVDLTKQRETIEKYQEMQRVQEEKDNIAKQRKEEKVRFYERKEADDQIRDLKTRVLESNKKSKHPSQSVIRKKTSPVLDVEEDDELSDLKDDEEEKVKKLLGQDSRQSLNLTSDSKKETIRNLISDIFDDMDVDNADDLDSTKLDELLERSTGSPSRKTTSKQPAKPVPTIRKTTSPKRSASSTVNNKEKGKQQVSTALNKLKPSKSPVRSRKELNNQANKASSNQAQLNRTYDKVVDRKPSPTVRVERELSEKRNQLHDVFTHQRERDAKVLLKDILEDNLKLHELERQSLEFSPITKRRDSKSPATSLRHKASSPTPPVPPLRLNETISKVPDVETARMSVENKKPSLMAQTITQLKRQESMKQADAERILRQLENRAQSIVKKEEEKPKQIKYIKSFTDFVHLQNPNKLRNHPDHKAISYGEQLMMHQENTIKPETSSTSMNQLFKIYGTRRVKGVYNNYERKGPRQVKTYSERLRELKPQQTQVTIKAISSNQSQTRPSNQAMRKTSTTQIKASSARHNLQTKAKVAVNGAKVKLQRFTPYNTPYQDEDLSDMSRWSLDDKLKNIIYDDGGQQTKATKSKSAPINKKKKQHATKSKDYDQETLADIDADYMLDNLIEEEAQNEKVFQNILHDLSDIERKEKQVKDKSSLSLHDREENDEELDDYVNQVDIDELANISLSNESVSSFIDWDQIDKLVNEFK